MNIHLRIQRWVVWWFYVGLACGVIAVVNILGQHLTAAQDRILLILGGAHWVLGGIVCWAFDGIQVEQEPSGQDLHTAHSGK